MTTDVTREPVMYASTDYGPNAYPHYIIVLSLCRKLWSEDIALFSKSFPEYYHIPVFLGGSPFAHGEDSKEKTKTGTLTFVKTDEWRPVQGNYNAYARVYELLSYDKEE